MAKTLKRHSDGNLLRVGDFLVEKCQDCEECSYCSDGSDNCTDNVPPCPGDGCCTPHRWSVTTDDLSACTSCTTSLGNHWKITSFSISGAYILTQRSACVWENTNIGSIAYTVYSGAGCSGSTTVTNSGDIRAYLVKTDANAYTFKIANANALADSGYPQFFVFEQVGITATADQCNVEIEANSNDHSACFLSDGVLAATGGTNTITPCP